MKEQGLETAFRKFEHQFAWTINGIPIASGYQICRKMATAVLLWHASTARGHSALNVSIQECSPPPPSTKRTMKMLMSHIFLQYIKCKYNLPSPP